MTEGIERLIEIAAQHSPSTPALLRHLAGLAEQMAVLAVPGDIVECGVYNGASAAVLAAALPERHVWLYDAFAGLPEPELVDGPAAQREVGNRVGDIVTVRRLLGQAGRMEITYTIRAGWFAETFGRPPMPSQIAVLHLDADWYRATLLGLRTFYDRVADGGCVILDDFGHFEGCRIAFYEFCEERRLRPLVERFGHSQLWWIKGQEHNRP